MLELTEGIVWLRVGGNSATGIARSALVINKPEGFSTTTDSCYSCHVDYAPVLVAMQAMSLQPVWTVK